MSQPDPPASIPPPIGNKDREAWQIVKAFQYQIWYAVLCWIKLKGDADLFIETAEDVDLASTGQINAGQLKHTAASLSLNTAAAMKALRDFWELKHLNKERRLFFNYITTGDTAKEEKSSFTGSRAGLEVWENAKTNVADAEEIRVFLLAKVAPLESGKDCPLPKDLIAFLKDGPIEKIQEQLICPITWQTNAPSYGDIVAQVGHAIFEYSDRINDPFPEDAIDEFRNQLVHEAMEVAISKRERRLTARKFADLFKGKTRYIIPGSMKIPGSTPSEAQPAPPPPIFPINWSVPSADLEKWPTFVGSNRELERPELETITEAIKENPWSAHILLGEAGSGKSALLAKLTQRLAEENIPYLGLKADFIPADIDSLNVLVPSLVGKSLANAVKAEAQKGSFVVLVDQLDAVCSLVDRKTRRLTLILHFLRELAHVPNVHIVASCRPFEFASDLRLQALNATSVRLNLPAWEKIAALLREEGLNPNDFTGGSKEVLRVPWNLKLFLSLKAPRPVLNSFYDLADKVWDEAVQDVENAQRHLELVDLIARRIDDEEDFWIPKALTAGYVPERNHLVSEGILLQPPEKSLIGFRHQTFYDYFLLNVFLREGLSLDQYITQHKESFFIRPTVTRALAYLRESNLQTYHKTLNDLMVQRRLRRHLKYLLIEFIGKQQAPNRDEATLLMPMLSDEALGRQFLQAISGSKGWFVALEGSLFETEWMTSKTRSGIVASILGSAMGFAEDEVVSLISKHWLNDPSFDSASLWVLSQAKTWKPATLELLQVFVKRAKLEDSTWALNQLIRTAPTNAAPVIGHLFKKAADEVKAELEAERAAATPVDRQIPSDAEFESLTPAEVTKTLDRIFYEEPAVKKIKTLLAGDLFHHAGLGQVANHDPNGFLRETWPETKRMLELTQEKKPAPAISYERDSIGFKRSSLYPERHESVIEVTERALEQLAKTSPALFQAWADQEKSSWSFTVHRLIAAGASALPPGFANWVMSYLLGDLRRLYLGDFSDESEDTRDLIAKFGEHASQTLLDELTVQIVDLPVTLLPIAERLYPNTDEHRRIGVLRRERARLLAVFPQARLSAPGQAALAADTADFGPPSGRRSEPRASFVGAPVRADEFAGKSEDEVFAVLEKYPDDYNRSLSWMAEEEEISRSGGVLQQANAFAGFSATNIEMGRSIIKRLKPGRHEKYAAALLRIWVNPKQDGSRTLPPVVPLGEIEQLVLDFANSGFNSEDFRINAAQVLQDVAKNNKGLRPETVVMLKEWLPEMKLPEPGDSKPSDRGEIEHSILYASHGGWLCPTGRAPIVEAIIQGGIFQEPAPIEETVDFLEKLFETEHHPAVWAEALIHTPWLVSKAPERMSRLIDKLFAALPDLILHSQTAHFLPDVSGIITPPELEGDWISKLLEKQDPISQLLAGELTILNFVRCKTPWSTKLIAEALAGRHGEEFLRGITFGAAVFLREKRVASDLEPILAKALRSPAARVQDAALTFLHHVNDKTWTPSAKRLVEQVLQSNLRQKRSSESLASQMESVALVDPDFALTVAEHYVTKMAEEPTKSNDWTWGASHLTNIALTALRDTSTRDRGLKVFEDLLDLSVQDAKKAADMMNHRDES
jgi:hypothetical protein